MSTPVELLAAASGAIAGTMGTDLYEYVRGRCAELIRMRSDDPDADEAVLTQLDTIQDVVVATPEEQQQSLEYLSTPVAGILGKYLDPSRPEDKVALQELLNEIGAHTEPAGTTVQNVTKNRVKGDQNVAGRDNNVRGSQ